jgi:hypothetical protein
LLALLSFVGNLYITVSIYTLSFLYGTYNYYLVDGFVVVLCR